MTIGWFQAIPLSLLRRFKPRKVAINLFSSGSIPKPGMEVANRLPRSSKSEPISWRSCGITFGEKQAGHGPANAHTRQLKVATLGKGEWTKGSVGMICPL